MKELLLVLAVVVAALAGAALTSSGLRGIFWLAFVGTLVPLEYIDRYFLDLPGAIKWLPEIAIVGAGAAAWLARPGSASGLPGWLLAVWAAIVAQGALSMAVHRSSPVAFLLSLRGTYLFFGAYMVQRTLRGIYDKDRILELVVGGGIASSLACFLERLTIARTEGDRVTGLFSLGEVVLFYHLVCVGIVLAYWLEGRRVGRWNTGLALSLLVLSLAIGNQEAALPYLGIVLAYLFVRARARRGPLLLIGLALPAGMLLVFTVIYDASYSSREGSYSRAIFEPAYIQRYLFGEKEDVLTPGGDLLRGAAVVTSFKEISGERTQLLLGEGPGATTESGFAGASGHLALEYPGIGRVTLSLLLGDTGLLGVALYVLFLVLLWWRRPRGDEPHAHRMVRELVALLALGYLIYARMTYEPCYAWILAAVLLPSEGASPDGISARAATKVT